jgi:exodeoxyribonuclease VII large subunit
VARLPFRSSDAVGPPPEHRAAAGGAEPKPLSVSQASDLIKRTLEDRLPSPLRVIGEVSGLSARNHWYFSLKDDEAVLSCVVWASTVARLGFTPSEGDEVLAVGHVSHYAPQGRTQFYVSRLEPVGGGALAARFKAMCDELRRLGYFDEARKKPLPAFPRRVAVITSRHGAALRDVIDTAQRRCPAVELVVIDVRVQGDGAAEEIARAIAWVDGNARRLGFDALLVTRGGGSIDDLWAFNERAVADAVFRARIPIVAAIGHESDTTVIELVADLRAATPTQATMRLLPDSVALREQLWHLRARLALLVRRHVERSRQRLEVAARHDVLRRPGAIVERQRQRVTTLRRDLSLAVRDRLLEEIRRVDRAAAALERIRPAAATAAATGRVALLASRLRAALSSRLAVAAVRTDGLERQLRAVDPTSILRRGFSMTERADGSLVTSVAHVRIGDRIRTRVADGAFESTVRPDGGGPDGGKVDEAGSPRTTSPRRRPAREDDAPRLFSTDEGE